MRIITLFVALLCLFGFANAQLGPNQSFCDKYTAALFTNNNSTNQQKLITAVVVRAVTGARSGVPDSYGNPLNNVTGLFQSPLQIPIFNGSVAYKTNPPNYITNSNALGILAGKLAAFFGAGFGCTAAGFPAYVATGNATQAAIHTKMGINKAIMNDFISILASTLTSFNVTSADVSNIAAPLLTSFNRCAGNNEICNAADCDQAPNTTCPKSGYASANAYTSWAVVAVSWILFFLARKNL